MKYFIVVVFLNFLVSCSLFSPRQQMREYENTYEVTFISLAYKRFLDDKKWKDRVSCDWGQSNLTYKDFSHMYYLVDSLEKVFISDMKGSTNGIASPETHEFDKYCVIKSIMETVHSKSFKKSAKNYASNKLKTK